jgi:hypothetical protein
LSTREVDDLDFTAAPAPNGPEDYGANAVAAPTNRRRRRFELIPFDDITVGAKSVYLVKGLLPRVGIAVFWGPPKCGKSFLVFDLSMHVALGWEYRGRRVKPGPVVYCALEGAEGFKARVEAFRQRKLGKGPSGTPFHLMATPLSLVADQEAFIESLRAQLGEERPVAIVIDTLNRSLAGSESDDRDMSAYVRASDAVREAFDCLAIIIHHCGHNGERPRGHSSLMGALDVQIAVKRDAADNVVAELELAKDGPVGDTIVSRLEQITIGLDEDGDPITSCIIEAVVGEASRPAAKRAKLPAGAQIALEALREAIGESGEVPPASNHIPQCVKTVGLDRWKVHALKRGISTSDDPRAKRLAFQRASERLVAAKEIGIWDQHAWLAR